MSGTGRRGFTGFLRPYPSNWQLLGLDCCSSFYCSALDGELNEMQPHLERDSSHHCSSKASQRAPKDGVPIAARYIIGPHDYLSVSASLCFQSAIIGLHETGVTGQQRKCHLRRSMYCFLHQYNSADLHKGRSNVSHRDASMSICLRQPLIMQ